MGLGRVDLLTLWHHRALSFFPPCGSYGLDVLTLGLLRWLQGP